MTDEPKAPTERDYESIDPDKVIMMVPNDSGTYLHLSDEWIKKVRTNIREAREAGGESESSGQDS